jgi:hypothetical protein
LRLVLAEGRGIRNRQTVDGENLAELSPEALAASALDALAKWWKLWWVG